MKRLILIALLVIAGFSLQGQEAGFRNVSFLDREVKQSHSYYSIGGGFPALVTFSAGRRCQNNHYGFDYGVGITPLIVMGEVHAYGNFLYYPKPQTHSQIYYGLGSNLGYACVIKNPFFKKGWVFVQPSILFGKQYMINANEKRFFQAEISPVLFTHKRVEIIPRLTVTYGIFF